MTYDPAFMNTANRRSAITYIDGDNGVLLYRGYPIEQLAEESIFDRLPDSVGELPMFRSSRRGRADHSTRCRTRHITV
jgi:citrate synthase